MANIQSDKAHAPARETAGTRLAAKRAAKAARKASQRGKQNPAEQVAKSLHEVNAWIDTHGRKVWVALGAVALAFAVWLGLSSYHSRRDREAGELLHTAVTTSEGIVLAPDEPAPEDAIVPTFTSLKERDEKAIKQFRQVDAKFPNSRAAGYALLGEANAQLELRNYDQSDKLFAKLRERVQDGQDSDDVYLRFRMLEGSGYALEGRKQYADAAKQFEALSKLHNGEYRMFGDYHRARMLVLQGKRDEARKVLEELSKAQAERPEKADEPSERFESVSLAADTLLAELGGKPAEKAAGKNSGISQRVLDALRKQLGSAK